MADTTVPRLAGTSLRHPSGRICADCDVRQMAICDAMDDCGLTELQRILSVCNLDANEVLVEEGAVRKKVFTLTAGMLRLYKDLPDGRRQIAGFAMPGDYLGLADDHTYSQTVEAIVPSTLCAFKVTEMETLMTDFPELKDRLYAMTRMALRQARDSQMILGRLAPVEKLASFLLMLSARGTERGKPQNLLHLPMSRTDIADYLGLTIETVSRSFTKLKVQGLIRLPETHLVEIADRRALTDVAGMELPE